MSTPSQTAVNRFIQHGGRLQVSLITVAELTIWASRANASPNRAQQITDLLKNVMVLEVTLDVGCKFGAVQAVGPVSQEEQEEVADQTVNATTAVYPVYPGGAMIGS